VKTRLGREPPRPIVSDTRAAVKAKRVRLDLHTANSPRGSPVNAQTCNSCKIRTQVLFPLRPAPRLLFAALLVLACLSAPALLPAAPPLPLGQIPPGKTFLVIHPHHDDHTWQYGFGGLIAKMVDAGYQGAYVRVTNDDACLRSEGPLAARPRLTLHRMIERLRQWIPGSSPGMTVVC